MKNKKYTQEEVKELLFVLSDELDVASNRLTPPTMVSLVVNKVLGL